MNMNATGTGLVNRGFSDVDGSGQADEHAAYLDRAARSVAAERERWLDRLELGHGDVALDAGSGLGEVALLLGSRVVPDGAIVGVDLSAQLVERARARAEGVGNVEYKVGDVTSLPFEGATFVAEGAISRARGDAYLADQDRRTAEGRFQITTLRYLLNARKPGPTRLAGDR